MHLRSLFLNERSQGLPNIPSCLLRRRKGPQHILEFEQLPTINTVKCSAFSQLLKHGELLGSASLHVTHQGVHNALLRLLLLFLPQHCNLPHRFTDPRNSTRSLAILSPRNAMKYSKRAGLALKFPVNTVSTTHSPSRSTQPRTSVWRCSPEIDFSIHCVISARPRISLRSPSSITIASSEKSCTSPSS